MKNHIGYVVAAAVGACFAAGLAIAFMQHHNGPKPPAPPIIQVPEKAIAEPGIVVPLDIGTKLGTIKWYNVSGAGKCSLMVQGNGHRAFFSAPTPGEYYFVVWGAKGNEPTDLFHFKVTVGNAPPPGPGPGPNPPPGPTDPLTQALQTAYSAETEPDKATSLKRLADLYALSASSLATDQNAHTWGDLFQAIYQAGAGAGIKGKILGVQTVLQKEFTANLPTDPKATLDASGRSKAADEFTKASKALQGVKP